MILNRIESNITCRDGARENSYIGIYHHPYYLKKRKCQLPWLANARVPESRRSVLLESAKRSLSWTLHDRPHHASTTDHWPWELHHRQQFPPPNPPHRPDPWLRGAHTPPGRHFRKIIHQIKKNWKAVAPSTSLHVFFTTNGIRKKPPRVPLLKATSNPLTRPEPHVVIHGILGFFFGVIFRCW